MKPISFFDYQIRWQLSIDILFLMINASKLMTLNYYFLVKRNFLTNRLLLISYTFTDIWMLRSSLPPDLQAAS